MTLVQRTKKVVFSIITNSYRVAKHFVAINDKTLLFISYHGRGYTCNPKYIHQALLNDERFKDYKFVWALKDTSEQIEGAEVIKYRSFKYFYYLAVSKFWISNCKLPEYCSKKKNQIYINTWHGVPLKRLAHDIDVPEGTTFYRSKMSRAEMTRSYDIDTRRYNYLVSPNSFTTDKYKSCFKVPDEKIKEYGYPRNDFLVNLTQEQIKSIKERLNLPSDKKVILYAPTWRDDSFNTSGYTFELNCDFDRWKHYLEKEYVVIFKPHYLISNNFNNDSYKNFLFVADAGVDINDLYAVSDILITDYSSVFFDFSILNRSMLFYMYDVENYRNNLRGFYLNVETDLPGQVVTNEGDLLKIIVNDMHNFEDIKEKRRAFIEKFHSSEKGDASKKVIDNLIYPHTKK